MVFSCKREPAVMHTTFPIAAVVPPFIFGTPLLGASPFVCPQYTKSQAKSQLQLYRIAKKFLFIPVSLDMITDLFCDEVIFHLFLKFILQIFPEAVERVIRQMVLNSILDVVV